MTHSPHAPITSVVVATHDRVRLLARLVGALEAQEGAGPFEVIIVDDASADGTWDELQALAQAARVPVRPLRLPRNSGPATARNAGWRAARAPIVAFTDDDCVPRPGWLAALLGALDRADLVQGRTLPAPEQVSAHGPFSRTLEVTSETGFYQTCNMGYHRPLLERLGGFDERFRHPTGEDTDLAWRARQQGARSTFESTALVHHDVRPSSFLTHIRDTARWEGVVLAVRLHPSLRGHLHRRWFWKDSHPPAILAAGGIALGARWDATAVARLVGLGLVFPYIHYRLRSSPLRGGPRRRVAAIPAALVADLAEVAVMTAASVRYRSLLL
jgi:glycosyltransferase involved in cell wall biosynthesis